MKNVFQITGIVAIFFALLIPQYSYGQVKIGDAHQGGIVFYVDGNGGGLICSESNQSNGANLEDAIKICDNLTLEGYDDWHLPTMNDLRKMSPESLKLLDFSLQQPGSSPAFYWTSNKVVLTIYTAHNDKGFDGGPATKLCQVRAVRAF